MKRILPLLALCALGACCAVPSRADVTPAAPRESAGSACSFTLNSVGDGRYDLDAEGQDAVKLLRAAAKAMGFSLALVGSPIGKATVSMNRCTPDQAVDLIARSAGLAFRMRDGGYVVGLPADIAQLPPGGPIRVVYQCHRIAASSLVTALQGVFDPQQLHVLQGPTHLSPSLDGGTAVDMAAEAQGSSTGVRPLAATDPTQFVHDVILQGDEESVRQALVFARRLDRPRGQVAVHMTISDVSVDALRQLGLTYDWSSFSAHEVPSSDVATTGTAQVPGLKLGRFSHDPVGFSATLSALETQGRSKVLASPTLTLMDGERSFLLIGEKLVFPKLVTSTTAGTPIYDIQEVRVGIYIQVAARLGEDGSITLTVYPQVSAITDFLKVNGASYPQISTREQQTTIRVSDGQTFMLGGLIRNDEVNALQRVPILSRIPLLGELFTYRSKTKSRSELIMTIRAEILPETPPNPAPKAADRK